MYFFVWENRFLCTLLCLFISISHKKWRGCENKSIFPFISQYITVVFFILIRGYRIEIHFCTRKYDSGNPFTSIIRNVRKRFKVRNSFRTREYKKFQKAIYQYYPEIAFICFVSRAPESTREWQNVDGIFSKTFCILYLCVWNVCRKCVYKSVCVKYWIFVHKHFVLKCLCNA